MSSSVMMGGVVLDLRESGLPYRPARLDVLSIMGGVQLIVPANWKVQIDVAPTMGGVRDGRTGSIEPERPFDVAVSGRVVVGGLVFASELPGNHNRRLTRRVTRSTYT